MSRQFTNAEWHAMMQAIAGEIRAAQQAELKATVLRSLNEARIAKGEADRAQAARQAVIDSILG